MSSIVQDAAAGLGRTEGAPDTRPLSDQERQQVARLLSDPFAFPQTFKAWLIAFLESSDLTLPISSIQGLGSTLGIGGSGNTGFIKGLLPPGTVFGWASNRVPAGCLLCNGVAYSRIAYASLFKEIGTTYGAGDGATTFNVPDLRRRVIMGVGTSLYGGPGLSENRAESGRSVDHHHVINLASGYAQVVEGRSSDPGSRRVLLAPEDDDVMPMAFYDTSGGYDQDHPAYLTLYFVITT